MNLFNNKFLRAIRTAALILLASFVLGSCGSGGSGGTTNQGTSIQVGAMLTKPLMDIAMVGQPYANTVALAPYDQLNKVISLSITNPTAGGSRPTIDNVGNVTWVANDIDFANTKSLRITAKMEQGADVILDTPVDVRNERIVYEVALDPNEASYTDPNGRYVVQTKKFDSTLPIAGSLKITEIFSGDGSFKPRYYLYNKSNVDLVIVEEPVSTLPAQSSFDTTPAPPLQAGAATIYPLTSLIGLSGIPSAEGSVITDGMNVYTSRPKFKYWKKITTSDTKGNVEIVDIMESSGYKKVFDFLGSCSSQTTCQIAAGTPVILIHGFTPEIVNKVLGAGDESTWGILPNALMTSNPNHAVFEMRWMTQMRFEEAAGKLLEFSKAVAALTGKKPMIIAHSFGGIVAHLALQNKGNVQNKGNDWIFDEPTYRWKSTGIDPQTVVSQLITLDSPLSGISDTVKPNEFTVGRHFYDRSINTCGSVTCVQAGSFDQGLDTLTLNVSRIDPEAYASGTHALTDGESIKRIQSGVTAIPFFTVAGTNQKPYDGIDVNSTTVYKLGDGLISLMGQAVNPIDFAIDPYAADKNFVVRFLSNKADLDTYDQLAVGKCLNYSYNDHNYWICPRAAHTASLFTFHRTTRQDYSIAYYEEPVKDAGYSFSHPLKELLIDPSTSIINPKQNWVDPNSPPPVSIVLGRTIHYIAGAISGVPLPITVTFTDKSSGVSSSGYLASSDSTGNFTIDIGKRLALIYGSTANIANYAVKLKIGDGLSTKIYTQTITNLLALQDVGNIDLTISPPPPVTASTLNDTGITAMQCYQAGSDVLVDCASAGALALNSAQDGMVGRDANAATNSNADGKLGFSFTAVAEGANPLGCVQDNVTGLMWENKTNDGGLRDWNKTYTNYDSTTSLQKPDGLGGFVAPTQAEIDAPTNSIGFKNSVNVQGLCGYSDWRLPTVDELQSIVDYGVSYPGPTIDASWLPNTQGSVFWSSSPIVGVSYFARYVTFHDSIVGNGKYRHDIGYVRLVRAGQSVNSLRYTVSTNGQEVTDNQTKLIWRRCAEGMNWDGTTCLGIASTFTHEGALTQASGQASNTGIAWRLPNVKELSSVVDKSRNNPTIDSTAFPATPAAAFWSSSSYASNPYDAWYVNFQMGYVSSYYDSRSSSYYVRLVRTAP